MAQSSKKGSYWKIIGIVILAGATFWGLLVASYLELHKVGVYTHTTWEAIKACSYVPIFLPLLALLTIAFLYFYNRKSRTMQIVTISALIIVWIGILYPLILWQECNQFLSKQTVYEGSCTIISAQVAGQGDDRYPFLTITCGNGKTIIDRTPDLIAFAINHESKHLNCKLSPRNDLYCGQPE